MNITKEELTQIIKEEIAAVLSEKEGKKDACYHKVRARYDVWPSAYASGALVKCRKVGAKNWGNSKKNEEVELEEDWSEKYKRSIDCDNPKGFSQKAHCQGRKKNEDKIPGGLGDKLKGSMEDQHKQLAKMHKVSVEDIDAQVKKGIKVEMEHTSDEAIAHEIAMEHVYEDPKYYDKLSKIDEVYSEKQRRYMCAMAKDGAKRPKGLSQAEAKEMCEGPMLDEKKKKAGTESSKESSLRDWFKRKGAKGSTGGWVDCNSPDGKGGYKSCGRQDGEKRKKYPSCRPTPGACKERGKGKSWGKKSAKGKKG